VLILAEMAAADLAAARSAARDHARITQTSEDALLDAQIRAALGLCEAFCGCLVLAREAAQILPARPDWQRLAARPVGAILGVEGIPAEGAAFMLPVDAYAIDIDAAGDGMVRVIAPGAAGRVRVQYRAGLAPDWAALPAPIAQGIVRLAVHLFSSREMPDATPVALPPAAVAALWRPWRRMGLG
jgi:uncharacterized phiE125 gp8 family phage protein